MPTSFRLLLFFILLKINLLAQVKSPAEFLRRPLGEQFTPHHKLVDYVEDVAKNSPATVRIFPIGETTEGRQQMLAVVSSAENISHLEEIRQRHLQEISADGRPAPGGEPIAVVWLGYSVHGNEPAGSEASMKVLFDLATQTDPDIKNWLKNTVVIIDPSQNPDGYDRYTHWQLMASNRLPQPSPLSREHREPWPGGRPNHYYFDLNRDWAWQTQVESQNRVRAYHDWMPHVVADVHEQGKNNPYFFPPVAEPVHEMVTPFQRDFQFEIGKNNARHFDDHGWLYFTREEFDLLYPSYGDTYPTYNGAIGMTYERGGIGAGRACLLDNGDTLFLKDRIQQHYQTSMSTVEMASKNAGRLVDNFKKYFSDAAEKPRGEWRSFVVKNRPGDEGKIEKLAALLEKHQIKFGTAGQSGGQKGFNYFAGKEENFSLVASDMVVSCFQPHGDLAAVLLEPQTKLNDSVTYDITAWSLPLAFGLEAYALKNRLEPKLPYAHCSFSPIAPGMNAYSYVVRWTDGRGPRFLSEIFKKGVVVRRTGGPMDIDGQGFAPGSLVMTRADNADLGDGFEKAVSEAGMAAGIDVFPLKTGFALRGQDLGSGGLELLEKPVVALVYSDDAETNSFGHVWWHFERELEYPLAVLPQKTVESGGLDGITTIIVPEGVSIKDLEKWQEFAQKGGHIVVVGEAVKQFADKDGFDLKKKADPDDPKKSLDEPPPFGEKSRSELATSVFGAITKNRADPTNPLAFGLGEAYFSLKTGSDRYEFLKNSTAVWLPDNFVRYGFIGSKLLPQLGKTLTAGRQKIGRGSITYLIDPPLFRGFWEEGKLLFDNAVFSN